MSSPSLRALRTRIDDVRRGGRTQVDYVPPLAEENARYRLWVAEVAKAAQMESGGAPDNAPPGFELMSLPPAPEYWILAERQGERRGAGIAVLRRGAARDVIVEAPHTFFDQGTLPISLVVFESQKARALLVNTVHRSRASMQVKSDGGDDDDDGSRLSPVSDVAHADVSFFASAHEVLLERFSGILTVQVHGFGDDAAPGTTVILSAAGSDASLPIATTSDVVGDGVRGFPNDIRKFGGTTNVEAKASRRAGAPFLHVEISRTLRDRLARDEALCRRFASAIVPARPGSSAAP
jgi:hypothetical protein